MLSPSRAVKIASLPLLALISLTLCWFVGGEPENTPTRHAPDRVTQVELNGEAWLRVDARANTHTISTQDEPSVDVAADGSTRVVWQSRRQQSAADGVYVRHFSPTGELVGEEAALNTLRGTDQNQPAVVTSADFKWAAWESRGPDGGSRVFLRRLDHAVEHRVTVSEKADPIFEQRAISLAAGQLGGVVATWVASDGARTRARIRTFDSDGKPMAPGIDLGEASVVAVASDTHGVVAVWQDPQSRLFAQRLDWGSGLVGQAVRIDDAGGLAIEPTIATGAGGCAVVWMNMATGGVHYDVHMRRLGANASPLAPSSILSDGAYWNSGASVGCFDDGRIAVAWNAEDMDSSASQVTLRIVDVDGEPGPAFEVGAGRLRVADGRPGIAVGPDGRIALAWSGDAGLGDRTGVHLTMLVPDRGAGLATVAKAATDKSEPTGFDHEFAATAFETGKLSVTFTTEPAAPHDPPVYQKPDPRLKNWGKGKNNRIPGGDLGFPGFTTGFRKLTPPDPHMAVGPDHIVSVVNIGIGFWTKDGTSTYLANFAGSGGFWTSVGAVGFIFDAEVHWDPGAERFIAMANERSGSSSYFLIAVSDDKNPNGNWHKYRVNVTASAGSNIDSPNLGIDDKALYLTADMYGNKRQYAIYIMEKKPLLSGKAPGIAKALSLSQFSAGIPVMWGNAPIMYMIRHGSSTSLTLYAIRDPLTNPRIVSTSIRVPSYGSPASITQRGTSSRINSFNARFWSCVWRNGSLWACHHQGSPVKSRWYEIKTNNWPFSGQPTLVQSGDVTDKAGNHASFNSIAVDESGNALMTFANSGPGDYLSIGRCWRLSTDPKGTMRPPVIVKRNTRPYSGSRWGDYSASAADPVDANTIWYTHELAPTSSWTTWFGRKRTSIFGTDVSTIDSATGGTVNFSLDNASHGGKNYIIIMTNSGTSPGFTIGGLHVPINIDAFTNEGISLVLSGNQAFQSFFGKLGPKGNKVATMTLPPLPPLKGQTLHFAFVQDLANWTFASPPAKVTFK